MDECALTHFTEINDICLPAKRGLVGAFECLPSGCREGGGQMLYVRRTASSSTSNLTVPARRGHLPLEDTGGKRYFTECELFVPCPRGFSLTRTPQQTCTAGPGDQPAPPPASHLKLSSHLCNRGLRPIGTQGCCQKGGQASAHSQRRSDKQVVWLRATTVVT